MKQGWEIKKLGEVCEIVNGGTPDTKVAEFWDGDNLWITPKDMGKLSSRYVTETERRITDEGLKNSSAKILPVDSVILSSRAPIGHLAINKKPISTNQGCKGLIPQKGLNNLYLYYFLSNSIELLNNLGSGTTFKELSGTKLSEVKIPLCPLSEQERIVGILDSAFAKIEALRANAQQNLQNTKDLFQASLKQELTPKQGWKNESIKDLSKDIFAGGDAPQDSFSEYRTDKYNIPIYANAVKDAGLYGFTDSARVIEPSLTIAARGSGTGYVLERKEAYLPIVRLIVIIPKYEQILLRYLYYSFKGLDITRSGSAIPQLTVPMIKNYTITFPSISEQQEIVEKLDAMSERCRAMEENYRQTTTHCNALKQALLTKAFNGKF